MSVLQCITNLRKKNKKALGGVGGALQMNSYIQQKLNKYLLNSYCGPGTMLCAEDTSEKISKGIN